MSSITTRYGERTLSLVLRGESLSVFLAMLFDGPIGNKRAPDGDCDPGDNRRSAVQQAAAGRGCAERCCAEQLGAEVGRDEKVTSFDACCSV